MAPEHRRGHGALYDALNRGRIQVCACAPRWPGCPLPRPADGRPVLGNPCWRWFSYLTTQLLQRGVYKNVQALEKDIRAWIKTWNEDARPFVWKKAAEEILTSLTKCLIQTSGAGH